MARSEAQKRADKFHAQKLYRFHLVFNQSNDDDQKMIEHLNKQSNRSAYIKALIKNDM